MKKLLLLLYELGLWKDNKRLKNLIEFLSLSLNKTSDRQLDLVAIIFDLISSRDYPYDSDEILPLIEASFNKSQDKKINRNQIGTEASKLLPKVTRFISFERLWDEDSQFLQQQLQLEAIAAHLPESEDEKILDHYEKQVAEALKIVNKENIKGDEKLTFEKHLLRRLYESLNTTQSRNQEECVNRIINIVDIRYFLDRLIWSLEAKIRLKESGKWFDETLFNQFKAYLVYYLFENKVVAEVEKPDHEDDFIIRCYYESLQLLESLSQPDKGKIPQINPDVIRLWEKLTSKNGCNLSKYDSNYLFTLLANYCAFKWVKTKLKDYHDWLIEIYLHMVNEGVFYTDNYLPDMKLKNLISLLCQQRNLDTNGKIFLAREKLKELRPKLNPKTALNTYYFLNGAILFYEEDNKGAEASLKKMKHKISSIDFDIDKNLVLLKIYCVENKQAQFEKQFDSFRKKLIYDEENGLIGENKRVSYSNFGYFIQNHLFNYGYEKKFTKAYLTEQLNAYDIIAGKEWLAEQIEGLK